jgi:Holliday junction resolvase RusA-like endonuclease
VTTATPDRLAPDIGPGDIWFTVPGKPEPLRRHRAGIRGGRVATFDDPRNGTYADRIRWAWREAGAVDLGDSPVVLVVRAYFARPKGHWTTKGTLSTAGKRAPYMTGRPDLDNLVKAVMDALNGHAYRDDSQVINYAGSGKHWTRAPGEPARLEVTARALRTDVDWMGT